MIKYYLQDNMKESIEDGCQTILHPKYSNFNYSNMKPLLLTLLCITVPKNVDSYQFY